MITGANQDGVLCTLDGHTGVLVDAPLVRGFRCEMDATARRGARVHFLGLMPSLVVLSAPRRGRGLVNRGHVERGNLVAIFSLS